MPRADTIANRPRLPSVWSPNYEIHRLSPSACALNARPPLRDDLHHADGNARICLATPGNSLVRAFSDMHAGAG